MVLGGNFPLEFRLAQIRRQLRPGIVIKLLRRMDDGQFHEKRFLVVHIGDTAIACVINSRVSKFIYNRPELYRCQVLMTASDHGFMDHDSHVDCSRTRHYAIEAVLRDLCEQPDWILGEVSVALRVDVVSALRAAATLPITEVELICRSLESL